MKSMIGSVLAVLAGLIAFAAEPVSAQESHSAPLAAELTALMGQQKLDAIAAKDPAGPDRFVAALMFPGVQLLVTSGQYEAPALIQDNLAKKEYREAYMALQSSRQDTRVFFLDLKADGLRAGRGEAPDIMYEHVTAQTTFDGDWAKHNMTEKAYLEKFSAADARYSSLLTLLVNQLKPGAK